MTLILTAAEIEALTGYRRSDKQLAELHRQGYWRARRSPTSGAVILERAHAEAVQRGESAPKPAARLRAPMLRPA
jgi:hypothetical protein